MDIWIDRWPVVSIPNRHSNSITWPSNQSWPLNLARTSISLQYSESTHVSPAAPLPKKNQPKSYLDCSWCWCWCSSALFIFFPWDFCLVVRQANWGGQRETYETGNWKKRRRLDGSDRRKGFIVFKQNLGYAVAAGWWGKRGWCFLCQVLSWYLVIYFIYHRHFFFIEKISSPIYLF